MPYLCTLRMKNGIKLLVALVLLMGMSAPVDAPSEKINWVDFNTGFAQADLEGKIAVIDCYTDWCGWCKVMDKKTFTNDTISRRLREDFIAIKFNPEKPGKYFAGGDSISGRELLMALSNNKPSGYPTFFFYVPQSKKMFQIPGYQDVKKFNETLDNLERYQGTLANKP